MTDLQQRLREAFRWRGDRTDPDYLADVTGWWRDPAVLRELAPALAQLAPAQPTVVLGPQSRGTLLGALVAVHLDVGLVEAVKDPVRTADSDAWWEVTTRPDYRDRHLRLGVRRDLLRSGDAVLFVDDWVETGGQVEACHRLVEASGAKWVAAAVLVDGLSDSRLRRRLDLRSVLHIRDL